MTGRFDIEINGRIGAGISGRYYENTHATDIFESIMGSNAISTGVVEHIEDFRIFVHGVGVDKVSDMTANIIRRNLIEYTQTQCDLHGIKLTDGIGTGPWWNTLSRGWEWSDEKMLVIKGRPILLVPKSIVSRGRTFSVSTYHNHFILNFIKRTQLASNGPFVRNRKPKKNQKVGDAYVNKKDLLPDHPSTKEFIAGWNKGNRAVYKTFREFCDRTARPLQNNAISTNDQIPDICNFLSDQLKNISPGNDGASTYHKLVLGILELIFYPNLSCPKLEQEINQGRKRIDISFENCAKDGEFWKLHAIKKIPSSYIYVECKNYGKDVANPELDQLSGRFSINTSNAGLLLCRSVKDYKLLIQRCIDLWKDKRELIVPIMDDDLHKILLAKSMRPESHPEEEILKLRIQEIIVS